MVLVLVLLGGPRTEAAHTVRELAAAALHGGHQVNVFLAGDGTAHAESMTSLRERGARVTACSADAAARDWDRPGAAGRGSFVDLGEMTAAADRVLVF